MGFFDLFKKAPGISPDETREYIDNKTPDEYCLLDVRQPKEYEKGHLPGARLVPVGELRGRLNELNPDKTTIVYCRSGVRSLSAASFLTGAGFKNVFSMEGGINRYNGAVASGPPEAGLFCFPETLSPGQLTAVAWFLEDGTIRFLERLRERLSEEAPPILNDRIDARKAHKDTLVKLFTDVTGDTPPADFPESVLDLPADEIMIGCVRVSDAIKWAEGKTASDILELIISLSTNTFDLYLKLGRSVKSEEARRVFKLLAEEEQENIGIVASAFEKTL